MDKVRHILKSLRPHHWLKSGFCLAALFFTANVFNGSTWLAVLPLVVVFSLMASAGYVFNDIWNREEDRVHPRKRQRPIASGAISLRQAYALLIVCYFTGAVLLVGFYQFGPATLSVGVYVLINTLYTRWLRKIPILDILTISFGFVLRVAAGAYAIGVAPSEWLLILTYLLALLLGLGKRSGEVRRLEDEEIEIGMTRSSLNWYSKRAVNMIIWGLIAVTLVAYLIYCYKVRAHTGFYYTALPVAVALSAYGREVNTSVSVEAPEVMILRQPILTGSLFVWGVMVIWFLKG